MDVLVARVVVVVHTSEVEVVTVCMWERFPSPLWLALAKVSLTTLAPTTIPSRSASQTEGARLFDLSGPPSGFVLSVGAPV